MDYDIEIIIKDESGIGFGYVYASYDGDDKYTSSVYQDRLNKDMLENGGSYEDIIEEIADTSKNFCSSEETIISAVNNVLDFYFIRPIKFLPIINKHKSFQSAIRYMEERDMEYLLFHV